MDNAWIKVTDELPTDLDFIRVRDAEGNESEAWFGEDIINGIFFLPPSSQVNNPIEWKKIK